MFGTYPDVKVGPVVGHEGLFVIVQLEMDAPTHPYTHQQALDYAETLDRDGGTGLAVRVRQASAGLESSATSREDNSNGKVTRRSGSRRRRAMVKFAPPGRGCT